MEKPGRTKFRIEGKIVSASQGQTTLEALLEMDFPIDHSCGGNGTCGTCQVVVMEKLDLLSPRNEIESEMAEDRKFKPFERLCCQTEPVEGMVIYRPERAPTKKGLE